MSDIQKAVAGWKAMRERINKGKGIKGLDKAVEAFAELVSDVGASKAIDIVELPIAPEPLQPPKRYPPVKWIIHKDSDGQKTHWTSTWQGMRLRVEKAYNEAGKVQFAGSIGGAEVAAEKHLKLAQSAVEAQALERARSRR